MRELAIGKLIRSKRFWSASMGLIVLIANKMLGMDIDPAAIVVVVGMLIGGYAAEDTARARNHGPTARVGKRNAAE